MEGGKKLDFARKWFHKGIKMVLKWFYFHQTFGRRVVWL
jgi:hypothetical protein